MRKFKVLQRHDEEYEVVYDLYCHYRFMVVDENYPSATYQQLADAINGGWRWKAHGLEPYTVTRA